MGASKPIKNDSRKSHRKSGTSKPDAETLAIHRLTESARRNELIAIIGTGVSLGLTDSSFPSLSWKGLIENGFAYGVKKGRISESQAKTWKPQLNSEDIDDLLGAAEFMGRKLGAPNDDLYCRWLKDVFKEVLPSNRKFEASIRALRDRGVPLCTLNYDSLLEQVTGLPTITMNEVAKVSAWMRRDRVGVLHLHGSWDAPATCILGIRDYELTLGNEVRDLIQRSLASFRRLLFIGCGDTFRDPNFSALVAWLRTTLKTATLEHYALVKSSDLERRNTDPTWQGFVEPLSFGNDHSELPAFLLEHFPAPKETGRKRVTTGLIGGVNAPKHSRLIQEYRLFLLRDCGQMTIEGMRANMDISQRRFDLERLFVPLKVLKSPPEISEADPERDQKLLQWKEENKDPVTFGDAFAQHNRIALLALPGGGKTILLKRLAVAYADSARRLASNDNLPDLDFTPVLIRCREWREHIHRPILTLLKNLPEITGQSTLRGIDDALLPLLKKGRVLLLVDGLDEIHDDALRSTFVEHLERFLGEFKNIRLVVTSREAGFSLIAPCLTRFCERWRVAPLEESTITSLCGQWHRLMIGDSSEAQAEGQEVAKTLIRNRALLRLAENPLLLTMLLVVKHGAGRLPPDRVSLYGRAVEVLLDTWNIKGHAPLDPKEAVPQLAFVAFRMLRDGKQTATEKELLKLLDEARESVPQIRRYAKDAPHEFLKRVEIRSSLLVEAGHQVESGHSVPFYQFRHLTFQEYLAAVAAVEGHYSNYSNTDSVLTPLAPHLTAEEWKEVIPMAAVLARKQAEPLISALVSEGNRLRLKVETGEELSGMEETLSDSLPAAVGRIVQCLVEEAEAAPETLTMALQLSSAFARGCHTSYDWASLCRGPYGEDLLHQAWLLYAPMKWPSQMGLIDSMPAFARLRQPIEYWRSKEGQDEIAQCLESEQKEKIGQGLFTCAGLFWNATRNLTSDVGSHIGAIERHLLQEDPALWAAAARAWGWFRRDNPGAAIPPVPVLDRLVYLWLTDMPSYATDRAAFALITVLGLRRDAWRPECEPAVIEKIKAKSMQDETEGDQYDLTAGLLIAFHARNIWSDGEISKRLAMLREHGRLHRNPRTQDAINSMLMELGDAGHADLHSRPKRKRKLA